MISQSKPNMYESCYQVTSLTMMRFKKGLNYSKVLDEIQVSETREWSRQQGAWAEPPPKHPLMSLLRTASQTLEFSCS